MSRPSGFSLIEMLAVLFVIVVMTSLVTLNINSGVSDRELQHQVEELMAVAGYAIDEAQFSGTDFGLLFTVQLNRRGERHVAAQWRERQPQGWRDPQRSTEVFERMEFAPTLELSLRLDGVAVPLEVPAERLPAGDLPPQWLFTASGETLPGELVLRDQLSGDSLWRIEWDGLGRFEAFRGEDIEVYETPDAFATSR